MKSNQQNNRENKIEIYKHEDVEEDNITIRTLFGNVQRTDGESDFQVQVIGLLGAIDKYCKGLVISRIALIRIDPSTTAGQDLKEKVLTARREHWYTRLAEARSYIAQADLEQLADPLLLHRFDEEKKKNKPPEKQTLNPKLDYRVEISPVSPPNPEYRYRFSLRVEHIHSPVPIDQGQIHSYMYRYGEPDENSAEIDVPDGDADLFLYRGSRLMDYSINSTRESEFAYASGGAGAWEARVYGFTAAHYEICAEWV